MAEPSGNARRALHGHFGHLLELLEKSREICGVAGRTNVRVNYSRRLAGAQRDEIVSLLDGFQQEVIQAAAEWHIDLGGDDVDATHALVVTLQFIGIALEEMSPSRLSGFGAIEPAFESAYEEFLQILRNRLDHMQQALVGNTPRPPSV